MFLLIGGMNSRLANSGMVGSIVKGFMGIPSNSTKMKMALESCFKTQEESDLYQDKEIEKA